MCGFDDDRVVGFAPAGDGAVRMKRDSRLGLRGRHQRAMQVGAMGDPERRAPARFSMTQIEFGQDRRIRPAPDDHPFRNKRPAVQRIQNAPGAQMARGVG